MHRSMARLRHNRRALPLFIVAFLGVWVGFQIATGAPPSAPLPPEPVTVNEPTDAVDPIRVAVTPIASAVEWTGKRPTGVVIDIWNEIAGRIGVATDFVLEPTFVRLLEVLPAGQADVSLGPLAITAEREQMLDFTHAIFNSGMRIAVRNRDNSGFLTAVKSFLSWQLLELLGCVMALAFFTGNVLWWCERRENPNSFPRHYLRGVGEAMWWIGCTIVTGGCDNKHVGSAMGRTIAFGWMVGGIVLLASFTSVLTATMTAERVVGTIHGPRDLAGRTVGCQQAALSAKTARQRGALVEEFPTVKEALDALALGMVEAVVGENQSLMVLVNQPNRVGMRLVGPIFETFDYGFGVPTGSPLRKLLNRAILQIREDGTLDRIKSEWLGQHD